jgi:hypothetical protein
MISCFARPDLPLTTTKKCFPSSLPTAYGPGPSTVSCAAIDSTFIHKDELISLISAYVSCKICSFLSTSLDCSARELFCMLMLHLPPCNITHLFHTISSPFKCPPDGWYGYWHPMSLLKLQPQLIQIQIWCATKGVEKMLHGIVQCSQAV